MSVQEPSKPVETDDEAPLQTGSDADLITLWARSRPLPFYCRLAGVDVAIVAAAEYRELLSLTGNASFAGARATKGGIPPQGPRLGLSTIERDPEVANFIRERFRGGITIDAIRDACRSTFGEERTPSRTRVQRFRQRVWELQ